MRGRAALSVLLAVAVPVVVLGNSLWILVNPWLVHAEYAIPGFPETAVLSDSDRTDLALAGIESVRPGGEGVEPLREERTSGGDPVFEPREVTHMQDVRDLLGDFLIAWVVALVISALAAIGLRRGGEPGAVGRALGAGALGTLIVTGIVALAMAVDFEVFFDGFHDVFFEGDSWRFNETYVLRALYPDFFWGVAGAILAALVLVQALALALVTRNAGVRPERPDQPVPSGAPGA